MKRAKRVNSNMGRKFAEKAAMRLADGGAVDDAAAQLRDWRPQPRIIPDVIHNAFADYFGVDRLPTEAAPQSTSGLDRVNRATVPTASAQPREPLPPGANNMIGVRGADGGHVSLRHAIRHGELHYGKGEVDGPGGPREDKVPAMLSDGEYVFSKKMVDASGGPDALDEFKERVHGEREEPSLRHFADGGFVDPLNPNAVKPGYNVVTRPNWIPGGNPPPTPVEPPISAARQAAWNSLEESLNRAPPGSTTAAAVEAAPKGRLASAGRFAGAATRLASGIAAPIAVAAPLTGFGDYKIDDPGVDSSAIGTLRAAGNQIRSAFTGTALPADREASQASLRQGAVEAGLDSASGLAKTADWAAGIVGAHPDYSGRLQRTVQGDMGNMLVPQSAPVQRSVANQPPPDNSLRADALEGSQSEAAPDNGLHVTRDGNNVSITGDRATRTANMFSPEQRASLRAQQYAPTQYGPSLEEQNHPVNAPGSWDQFFAARNARRVAAQQADIGQRERESIRTAGTLQRGQDMTAATARNTARIEQMNKDRQFGFDTAKAFGTDGSGGEQGRAEETARQGAAKAVHERITTMIPQVPGLDGKPMPDTETAARYTSGLNNVVGNAIKNGEKYVAANPDDVEAKRKLAKLKKDGIGALGEDDIRRHVSGMQTADIAQREHSNLNPFKGSAPQTSAPVVSLRHKPGLISDDYEVTYGDGSKGVVPARAIDKSSDAIFGMGGQRRSDSNILKTPSLRNQ